MKRGPAPKPCGTRAAYRRHRAKGEKPCAPCKAANAEWQANHQDNRVAAHPCPGCNKSTRSPRLCADCRDEMEIGLYAGDWVVRGGIKVWVPWRVEAA